MEKYSKNTIWGVLRDTQKNTKEILPGRANSATNTPKILPGVLLEYFWGKIEIPKGAAAEGRRPLWGRPEAAPLFLLPKYSKSIPGSIFGVFFAELALPGSIFLVFF